MNCLNSQIHLHSSFSSSVISWSGDVSCVSAGAQLKSEQLVATECASVVRTWDHRTAEYYGYRGAGVM